MSDYLPLIVDLYFGDTTLSASLKKQKKDDASLPFWALKARFIRLLEKIVLRKKARNKITPMENYDNVVNFGHTHLAP